MIIKNGTVVTSTEILEADVRIEDGKITEIGQNLTGDAEVYDAKGKYVMPGAIDVHTHMELDVGIATATDTFYTGTVAAACGGTTAIVDHMGFGPKGCNLNHQLSVYHEKADDIAVIDYSFHGTVQHIDDDILNELEDLVSKGITSVKFYMTYLYKLDDYDIYRLIEKTNELGIMITFHPENDGVIHYLKDKFVSEGKLAPIYHAKSRPEECEAEAIDRVLNISRMIGDAPIYVVHCSSNQALQVANNFRNNGLKNVFVETCPQYLFLDDEMLNQEDGLKYICAPPLRDKSNNELLWQGITDGSVQTIATDHCPFDYMGTKQLGKDNFTKTPGGVPGVELRPILIFSEGVMNNRITLNQYVNLISTAPAKLMGLAEKGDIRLGFDGDIMIIDPNESGIATHEKLHENVDYTPYEGIPLKGKVTATFLRGKLIAEDGNFLGKKGDGAFIHRKTPQI